MTSPPPPGPGNRSGDRVAQLGVSRIPPRAIAAALVTRNRLPRARIDPLSRKAGYGVEGRCLAGDGAEVSRRTARVNFAGGLRRIDEASMDGIENEFKAADVLRRRPRVTEPTSAT